ncbi:protein-glutamate methylesterase/protein-glutamine glutaminase [Kerstersia gyiorum]|uniref:protein-glutamate methylesterase/protein-glutamine glutaminase n=1 Tax=Kerstersia gyiorum TaxID=206506 RepID=UPI001070B27E|nr:chemotaxis response regulator protein-glutamate methylesterase [Kerstersia gyiorum]QBR39948.1 chemotaxis response regulator protein-glutamate methylesterase [Kerstersia gyiorum]
MNKKIRVLCVDDSALVRGLMTEIINSHDDMEVVAVAPDPYVARELIKQHRPDVLTLDVEMPRMDGLDFLEKLMRLRPMPVLMVSSLTERGGEVTLRALELGAVDFVTKPRLGIRDGLREYSDLIAEKIRVAASARISRRPRLAATVSAAVSAGAAATAAKATTAVAAAVAPATAAGCEEAAIRRPALRTPFTGTEKIVVIGASTGGTEAIRQVLEHLPPDMPGILITQHMPAGFTRSFAQRLDSLCALSVSEARDGERVLPGHVYLAPGGDCHLRLARSGANYVVELDDGVPVNRHRPSVDVLFHSAAAVAGRNAIGVILTGMGKDGAAGLLAMRRAGAQTLAQDENSCVVYGMPREAVQVGAVESVVPLAQIGAAIQEKLGARVSRI